MFRGEALFSLEILFCMNDPEAHRNRSRSFAPPLPLHPLSLRRCLRTAIMVGLCLDAFESTVQ